MNSSEKPLEHPRLLSEDEVEIRARTLIEVAEAWSKWSIRYARKRRAREERVEGGELKGVGHTTSRLVLWFLALTDEDQERIQREGEVLLDRLRRLPYDDDRKAIEERRTRTVLIADNAPPVGNGGLGHPRVAGAHGVVIEGNEQPVGDRQPASVDRRRRAKH